jgi:hypothetical protein
MLDRNSQSRGGARDAGEYVPTAIPHNAEKGHQDLTTFITTDYTLQDEGYLAQCHQQAEQALSGLIETTDAYTAGTVCDAFLAGQIAFLRTKQEAEEAMHEVSAQNITKARQVRAEELRRSIPADEAKIKDLQAQIAPLRGKEAQFELRLGRFHLSVGALVTVATMVVDAFINKSYLESVLLQSQIMLLITVISMSVMSDGSMWVLGTLLSRNDQDFMDKRLYRVAVGGLITMFLLSVVSSVMIRFGSMNTIFGTINASGEFVGKDQYTLAEWGVALATAFVTTATGLISLVFSVDRNAPLAHRRQKLEAELETVAVRHNAQVKELSALEKSPNPMLRDEEARTAAETNLDNLERSLKLHARKLLALHQKTASYTDQMAQSAALLLAENKDEDEKGTAPLYDTIPYCITQEEAV